jgi:hypothetical protein
LEKKAFFWLFFFFLGGGGPPPPPPPHTHTQCSGASGSDGGDYALLRFQNQTALISGEKEIKEALQPLASAIQKKYGLSGKNQ